MSVKFRKSASPFTNIVIVGVGLIGGSLGLAIKRNLRSVRVIGVDSSAVIRQAKRIGAIDEGTQTLSEAVPLADCIILAASVSTIISLIPRIARICRKATVVTDVGSVKSKIVRIGDKCFPNGNFIGGHPMAGSERSGIRAADATLFSGEQYLLCPTSWTKKESLRKIKKLLQSIGAHTEALQAKDHDRIVAAVSHLPQLSVVALMNVIASSAQKETRFRGSGLRDSTRIARSEFSVWKDIILENQRNIIPLMRRLAMKIERLERAIVRGEMAILSREFDSANKSRARIRKKKR
jgi:prephenate dehydrogenase